MFSHLQHIHYRVFCGLIQLLSILLACQQNNLKLELILKAETQRNPTREPNVGNLSLTSGHFALTLSQEIPNFEPSFKSKDGRTMSPK